MNRSTEAGKFALKPIVAAVALATGAAWAAPTPNQMPGAGFVSAVSLGSVTPVGSPLVNIPNGATATIDGKVVIQWGGPGAPGTEVTNPYGFNLGANAAFYYSASSAGSSVLNIDASGNPTQIFGRLEATVTSGFAPSMFIANANGIVVGAGGRIVAPTGVGLIGANLNNATSINEFVGNNGWALPAAPAYGRSFVSFGAVPTTGNVTIAGAINGDFVLNKPAQYILIAGNNLDVLNTGNLFGVTVELNMGVVGASSLQSVGGLTSQTVNRLWDVDSGGFESCCFIGTSYGNLQLAAGATGNVTNEGSISAAGTGPGEWITIQAKGNVRSGIAGNTDELVGLFSDQGIYIDSYSSSSAVELYNVVSGYTTNKTLPFLRMNRYAYAGGMFPDVTIDALTPGLQPSSIATTGQVLIFGGNVDIRSTINHKNNASGGVQLDSGLAIWASDSVTISGAVGAGADVFITSYGPMTISNAVIADHDANGNGGIYINNFGAGAPTTISGLLGVPATGDAIYIGTNGPLTISGTVLNLGSWVDIFNNGTGAGNFTDISGNVGAVDSVYIYNSLSPANKPLTISGVVVANNNVWINNYGASAGNTTTISGSVTSAAGNVYVNHFGLPSGKLTVTGSLSAFYDVEMFSDGHAQIGTVNAGDAILAEVLGTSLVVDGPWTAGSYIGVASPLALAKLTPAGVLTAPVIDLMGLSFTGVNASGMNYADASEKPAAQLVTNDLDVMLTGSINGPIAGNTNWPLNSMDIAPLNPLAPVYVSVTANGGGFQAVNLRVLGDAIVDSGATTTPFINVPLTSGGLPAGGIQANLGSQLILAADGYMQVMGMPTFSLFGPLIAFQWPGGASFIAGTTLQTFTPVYNAWSTNSPPFGGVFFDAPYIALAGYIATSGTAWANFSSQPVTGDPTVYQIRHIAPASFGFEATTAYVKNSYLNTVTGGAVCTTLGPTTWTACP